MSNSRVYISDMTSAMRLDQVFLISQPQLRTTSRGDHYIAAFLSDRSGKLNGRMWQASPEIFQSLPNEGFVAVRGRTEMYQDALQMVIESICPVNNADVAYEDFMPATERDVDQMFARVLEILRQITNPHLLKLIKAYVSDKELMANFRKAPAAIVMHHAYLGGLLEHTLGVMEMGLLTAACYPQLDHDLLLTGCFLHDLGKTCELAYEISFKYSDQGRLLGHIVKGTMMIQEKIAGLDAAARTEFPPALLESLQHLIVSHHGVREFGCPVLPATPEAFALHHLDNLDAKIGLTFQQIQADVGDTHWTPYQRSIESAIFKLRPNELQ